MPNFQEFDRARKSRAPSDVATVTVQRTGLLSFNVAAIIEIGQPEAVVFLVDAGERLLGFRPATLRRGGRKAFAVRRQGGGNKACVVSAMSVLRHLDVDLSESRRYPLVAIDGTPCIDLKQPGTIVTSNRRKAEA